MASVEPQPERLMRQLWQRMAEVYGHRWTSAYGDDAGKGAGLTWAKGLAGMPPVSVARGLEAAIVSAEPWPPTLPEFRALCLGIPSLAAMRVELRGGSPATPFGRLVWSMLDTYRLRMVDSDRSERMVADAYESARDHVMRGGLLPEAPAGVIEAPKAEAPKPASPEVVAKVMEAAAAALGDAQQ